MMPAQSEELSLRGRSHLVLALVSFIVVLSQRCAATVAARLRALGGFPLFCTSECPFVSLGVRQIAADAVTSTHFSGNCADKCPASSIGFDPPAI